jgi:hypothetical protein
MKLSGSKPWREQEIDRCAALVSATMRRARNQGITKSMAKQAKGTIAHWFRNRMRGECHIHPGAKKMAKWAGCEARTASANMAVFRNWGFLVPVAYEKGGRRATRYVVNPMALLNVMTTLGANPSKDLKRLLIECDPDPQKIREILASAAVIENPAKIPTEIFLYQDVGGEIGALCEQGEKPCKSACKKPCKIADGIQSLPENIGTDETCGDFREDESGPEPSPLTELPTDQISPTSEFGVSADARLLLAHLRQHGPTTYGAAAAALGWGATRAWQAEAALRQASLIHIDKIGRMSPRA